MAVKARSKPSLFIHKDTPTMADTTAKSLKGIGFEYQSAKFTKVTSEIGQVAANLSTALAAEEREIRADKEGLLTLKAELLRIQEEKAAAQARIARNKALLGNFGTDFGPIEAAAEAQVAQISALYDMARERHAHGIDILKRDFGYHPLYKRPGDGVTGVPFKPRSPPK